MLMWCLSGDEDRVVRSKRNIMTISMDFVFFDYDKKLGFEI